MTRTLTLRVGGAIPIDVSPIMGSRWLTTPLDELARTPIVWGNQSVPLGDCFALHDEVGTDRLLVRGDCRAVRGLGQGWSEGTLLVDGPIGMHVGAQQTGGVIEIDGDAADWAGAERRGGTLRIRGNAGDCLAGAYRGANRGMLGGEVFVHGHCGDEAGIGLRRGTIIIAGNAGGALGADLLAGTILVYGRCGAYPGAGMKRGTLGLFGGVERLLPTFSPATVYEPNFLRVLARHAEERGLPFPAAVIDRPVQRWCGDFAETGRGELLLPASQ